MYTCVDIDYRRILDIILRSSMNFSWKMGNQALEKVEAKGIEGKATMRGF